MTIETSPALVVGFVLAVVRAAAWVALIPPFASRSIPAPVKIGLAAALALPVAPRLAADPPSLETAPLVGAVLFQVGVGLGLGFLTSLLFGAVQAAGDLIDLFGGFTIAQAYDPLSNSSSALFGRFYQLLATVLLFALDGHLLLVRGFMTSFRALAATPPPLDDLSALAVDHLGLFVVAAIEIAAPLLGALFLAEVALGLLARAAPQMNVFVIGFPFKILLTLLLGGLTLPLLPGAVGSLVTHSVQGGTSVVRMLGG